MDIFGPKKVRLWVMVSCNIQESERTMPLLLTVRTCEHKDKPVVYKKHYQKRT